MNLSYHFRFQPISISFLFWLLFSSLPFCVQAQEEQIAFIPGVFELDAKLRENAGVLEKFKEDFSMAKLYRQGQQQYVVEITYAKRGKKWNERHIITAEEIEKVRAILTEYNSKAPPSTESSSGRAGFITGATLMSIPQGILLSYALTKTTRRFDPWFGISYTVTERTKFGKFSPFLFSAGVFTGTLLGTRDKVINPGSTNVYIWSSGTGIYHGSALVSLFAGENAFNTNRSLAVLGATSFAEAWILHSIARKKNISYARSMAWNTGNIWGTVSGVYTGIMIIGGQNVEDFQLRISGGMILAGGVGGILLGNYLHNKYPRTTGDYRSINSLAFVSNLIGIGISEWPDYDSKALGLRGLLSTGVGTTLGYLSTKNTQFSSFEGIMVAAGTGAGTLLGIGSLILIEPDADHLSLLIPGIGGLIGWATTYLYMRSTGDSKSPKKSFGNTQFYMNPAGVMLAHSTPERQYQLLSSRQNMDILGLKWSW